VLDVMVQGWQLMDGHLNNVLQGITVSKKVRGLTLYYILYI
jgi:hypothetical protein